ncbi:mitochondrial carrier domain-containing protein [Alternaria rosae]|uniref:mitochondrial carrier domain-containing protein n=1 Tax=Alternaria rosae TaxID=1187941 RepID=UPI001E8D9D08|nr:mitochondrial carrier domain-containing protein [Alternaria rosae]KAH6861047.1 mitochondrial carrier domain-containing protein [Alternaria rosae]
MLDSPRAQPPQAWVESPYLRSLIAGGLAGTTVDLSLYPLDTLKTRLQSASGFAASGGFNGIYRGVGSAIVGSAPGAALFFITYDTIKRSFAQSQSLPTTKIEYNAEGKPYKQDVQDSGTQALIHMAAASAGEVAACAVRVPTEVIKQRAQASQHPSSLSALTFVLQQRHTRGLAHVWMELYRGWSITIIREVPFTVIQFPLWEALKKWRMSRTGRNEVTGLEGGLLGSVAGAVAAGVTTPLDVLKTRMMLAREKQPMVQMLGRIMRESGPRAFFAGMGPRVGWISVGGAIFLGSYQWASNALGGVVEE